MHILANSIDDVSSTLFNISKAKPSKIGSLVEHADFASRYKRKIYGTKI